MLSHIGFTAEVSHVSTKSALSSDNHTVAKKIVVICKSPKPISSIDRIRSLTGNLTC